jgi:hypothetical protein
MPQYFDKDPSAILDYTIDWAAPTAEGGPWLGVSETIVESTWTLEAGCGLTAVSDDFSGTATIIRLSGGNIGEWGVINHIVTSTSAEDERTLTITVVNR